MEQSPYQVLKVSGEVSTVPPWEGLLGYFEYAVVIMGPIGSGKSSFIEVLDKNLKISGDQLESCTQQVTGYDLVNVLREFSRVCILDTPGFSDSNMSEFEIIALVNDYLKERNGKFLDHIYIFIPITRTRLEGSRLKSISLMREYLRKEERFKGITFVTTMWDTLHNDNLQRRAESNFAQLRDEKLKEYIDGGACLVRFENTQESALRILDIRTPEYVFETRETRSPPRIYEDLYQRVQSALLNKQRILADLCDPEVRAHSGTKSLAEKQLIDNEKLLIKFSHQLILFGAPPPGSDEAHSNLMARVKQDQAEGAILHFSQLPFDANVTDVPETRGDKVTLLSSDYMIKKAPSTSTLHTSDISISTGRARKLGFWSSFKKKS